MTRETVPIKLQIVKYDAGKRDMHDPMFRERSPKLGSPTAVKRLTTDVPAALHANLKSICAKQEVRMTDAIHEFLEDGFGKAE